VTFVAKVYVTPKPAVLDPAGKAVASSLATLGYT
jgi:phosphoribosylformylglycinamidine (FGAM) synthase PurS component